MLHREVEGLRNIVRVLTQQLNTVGAACNLARILNRGFAVTAKRSSEVIALIGSMVLKWCSNSGRDEASWIDRGA